MTANLFGDRFAGFREPAWHKLGVIFPDRVTAHEAALSAHLNYNFVKVPLVGSIPTAFGNQLFEVPNQIMVLREPTDDDAEYRYMGVATNEYSIIQNMELAEMLDRITDELPVETCGALGVGETTFYSLDAGMTTMASGEEIHQYFLVVDSKRPGFALKIVFTPVRVVCQNTLISGLSQATISAALNHDSNLSGALSLRIDLVGRMKKAREDTMASFEALARAAITGDQADDIFAAAYPLPKRSLKAELADIVDKDDIESLGALYDEASKSYESWMYYCGRANEFRTGARTLFERLNDEHPAIANTAWGAYNAVVESADYRNGADSMFQSALFGPRAQEKRRAFKAAIALVG